MDKRHSRDPPQNVYIEISATLLNLKHLPSYWFCVRMKPPSIANTPPVFEVPQISKTIPNYE